MRYGTLENGIMKPAPRAIRIGGRTPFTGFVTNDVTHEVMYFDQGFYKGNPEEGL